MSATYMQIRWCIVSYTISALHFKGALKPASCELAWCKCALSAKLLHTFIEIRHVCAKVCFKFHVRSTYIQVYPPRGSRVRNCLKFICIIFNFNHKLIVIDWMLWLLCRFLFHLFLDEYFTLAIWSVIVTLMTLFTFHLARLSMFMVGFIQTPITSCEAVIHFVLLFWFI